MRVLITGITGFVGSHLVDYVLAEHPEVEVFGIKRWRSRTENIEHFPPGIKIFECDLRDASSTFQVVEQARPDLIFHLAAQSFVQSSFGAPQESLTSNVVGELHIFEAVRRLKLDPWIQIACSSEEYGLVHEDELPILETNPLRPLSPYAVSKVSQDLLAYQYYRSYGLKTVRTRGFNHTGPRRGEVFVCSNFAKQIVMIERGQKEPVIHVGDLSTRRDFTDVRDMVVGYWKALTTNCVPGEVYNLCSGRDYRIQEVLDKLLAMSDVKIEVRVDPERLRPSDVPVLLGSNEKFQAVSGWAPRIPFDQTLRDILEYWRERVR
jgi:GDP-4-dehydro-6-deoxy-D-mannose reductase